MAHRFARLRAPFASTCPSEPFPAGTPAFVVDEAARTCSVVLMTREGSVGTPTGWLVPRVPLDVLEPVPAPTFPYRADAHPGMRFYDHGTEWLIVGRATNDLEEDLVLALARSGAQFRGEPEDETITEWRVGAVPPAFE